MVSRVENIYTPFPNACGDSCRGDFHMEKNAKLFEPGPPPRRPRSNGHPLRPMPCPQTDIRCHRVIQDARFWERVTTIPSLFMCVPKRLEVHVLYRSRAAKR